MASHRGVSLTQVHPHPGADGETDIDIIAIHGLDTKSPDTWVWKSKTPNQDVNWLACPNMLPGRVGRARIFMCDWPADLFEQPDLIQKTAKVFARLLLAGIKRRPLPKTRHRKKDRPIVFIASCLGGVILMKALLIADHPPSEYTGIRRSTRGIVFLATPFRGTSFQDVANWAEPGLRAWALIRGQKVSNLLDSVKGSTFHLEELVRSFTQLCQDKDYPCQVTTFYETGKTSLHRKFPLSWLIPSPLINLVCQPKPLVDSSSATLDIVLHPLPLARSHVMMNKFRNPEDPDYKEVVGKIEEILQNIRTGSLIDDADAWIRNKHYTPDRLKIERLSGDLLPMDQCYINLAVVEQRGQKEGNGKASPFSLFHRQRVETPDEAIQAQLETIFNERGGRDGKTIQPRRILIRGRAGVGKTTLCKKIVHEFTQGTWSEWNNLFDRVLWVPLRNLKLKERCEIAGYNFEQLFAHEFFSLSSEKSTFARELFLAYELELETNNSKTLFLLDGLDEVSQDLSEGSMSSFLQELLKQPNIIVTSRPSSTMPPGLDLELETIGFYPDQVKNYIETVFTDPKTTEMNIKTVDKIQSFLQSHQLIQGLVRIPIQLDALCYSWEDIRGDMPETMTSIYQAIELSLWKKDILRLNKRHCQSPVTVGHIQDTDRQEVEQFVQDEVLFLESLAFTGIFNEVIEFERKHLNRASKPIPEFLLNKTVPFLSFLRSSNPSSDNRNKSYHFIHLTFQEYFAARYFVRQWVAGESLNCLKVYSRGAKDETEPIKFLQRYKYTARYDILWRFVAGLLDAGKGELPFYPPKIEEFFERIEEEPLDLLGPTHQRLVMHCLSEVSSSLSIRTNLEKQLSKWLLFECGFTKLGSTYLGREIEFLEQALDAAFREGSDGAKNKILQSLSQRATVPASIVEWAASRPGYKEWRVWWSAALGRQVLLEEIHKGIAARLKDKDMSIRWDAVKVIRRRVFDPSDEFLKDEVARLKDKDASVRKAAATVLTRAMDVAAWLKDEDVSVREAAAKALHLQALPNEMLKDVAAQLENKKMSIPQALVTVMNQQVLAKESLKYISMRLRDKEESIQDSAAEILSLLVLPNEVLKEITAQLEDGNETIRRISINILYQQPALPEEVLKAITVHLEEEEDWSIQRVGTAALLKQKALPTEIVKARLENKNEFIQLATIKALDDRVNFGLPKEILEAVIARLQDENDTVREAAVCLILKHQRTLRQTALRQTALHNNFFKVVSALLEDKSPRVRAYAIEILDRQAALPSEILEAIAAQLGDEDEDIDVRMRALLTLGRQPALPQEILKVVAARLEEKEKYIRYGATKALLNQPALPDEILKTVALRLEDHDESVQAAAEDIIRRHEEFYFTLLKGDYSTALYKVLLRRSFKEHLSWYIDDGHLCINMAEGIRRVSIDTHDDIMAAIEKARPANFPIR
ncbi:peptidase C14 [Trichoderma harzianum]|uniref:Peptidase C14 n=1 Tax=Trichoderma harzianum TaxID=5544 RepID=A0A0F9XMV2_TRIHA|nr:peptidase C14 [Trichoderma harzianum]